MPQIILRESSKYWWNQICLGLRAKFPTNLHFVHPKLATSRRRKIPSLSSPTWFESEIFQVTWRKSLKKTILSGKHLTKPATLYWRTPPWLPILVRHILLFGNKDFSAPNSRSLCIIFSNIFSFARINFLSVFGLFCKDSFTYYREILRNGGAACWV